MGVFAGLLDYFSCVCPDSQSPNLVSNEFFYSAFDYVESITRDNEDCFKCGLKMQNSTLICVARDSNVIRVISSLFCEKNSDLSLLKDNDTELDIYILSPSALKVIEVISHVNIDVKRFAYNIKYLFSYLDSGITLHPLVQCVDLQSQSRQFAIDFFNVVFELKPLSMLMLETILKLGKYDSLRTNLLRYHINKLACYGYVGISLDEKIDNIGYLSGRILATMEYIASLSENREPLRLDYTRFSTSPALMLPKLAMIAKKYIYTVPILGRQMYLKNLLDSLLDKANGYQSTKRYLLDNDQAMFAIGYKHQTEYFADESFTSKFQISNAMLQPDKSIVISNAFIK